MNTSELLKLIEKTESMPRKKMGTCDIQVMKIWTCINILTLLLTPLISNALCARLFIQAMIELGCNQLPAEYSYNHQSYKRNVNATLFAMTRINVSCGNEEMSFRFDCPGNNTDICTIASNEINQQCVDYAKMIWLGFGISFIGFIAFSCAAIKIKQYYDKKELTEIEMANSNTPL